LPKLKSAAAQIEDAEKQLAPEMARKL
jgi:hypothetical protein